MMQEKLMENSQSFLSRFFSVPFRGQTYLNLVYLFLAFPLGLLYFILIVLGFSLGFGLSFIGIGLLILAVTVAACWAFVKFERQMVISLLHEDIAPLRRSTPAGMSTWDQIKTYLSDPVTWKSLLFLLLKFPLGIASFCVLVTVIALTLGFLTVPITYNFFSLEIMCFQGSGILIDTLWEAIACFLVGVALLFPSLHILNFLARISGRIARAMLS
jgi:hypothetical protein